MFAIFSRVFHTHTHVFFLRARYFDPPLGTYCMRFKNFLLHTRAFAVGNRQLNTLRSTIDVHLEEEEERIRKKLRNMMTLRNLCVSFAANGIHPFFIRFCFGFWYFVLHFLIFIAIINIAYVSYNIHADNATCEIQCLLCIFDIHIKYADAI